jgi:hypothetical protein
MERDEGRVKKMRGEDSWNILKVSTFHESSSLLSSLLLSFYLPPSQTCPKN